MIKDKPDFAEKHDKPRECIKRQSHHLANKGLYSQEYGFSRSYIWMTGP